jgi:hypothetical protein
MFLHINFYKFQPSAFLQYIKQSYLLQKLMKYKYIYIYVCWLWQVDGAQGSWWIL